MVYLDGHSPMESKEFMEYTSPLCILLKQRTILFFDMAVLRTYCIEGSSRTAIQMDQRNSTLIDTQINTSYIYYILYKHSFINIII